MGRDLQLKFMMLICALVALLSMSACAVASAPAPDTDSDLDEPAGNEVVDPSPSPESESVARTAPQSDDGSQDSESDAESATPTPDSETESVDAVEMPDVDEDIQGELSRDSQTEQVEEQLPATPARMKIDAIDVDAGFEYVGKTEEGNMDVPQEWENVAWYEPGTVPGDLGNAVVAGHYDSETGPAVFIDLNELSPGDEIEIETEEGEELVFEVTEVESVHVDDADPKKIFGASDERNLNLITCEGVWDSSSRMYDKRLIVYSTLVSE